MTLVALCLALQLPFSSGEKLTYTVSWTRLLDLANLDLTVRQTGSELKLTAEARPTSFLRRLYDVYGKIESTVDPAAFLPSRCTRYVKDGDTVKYQELLFDRVGHKVVFKLVRPDPGLYEFPLGTGAQDLISALYYLRTVDFEQRESVTVPIYYFGSHYEAEIRLEGKEEIKTPAGNFLAFRLKPVLKLNNQPFNDAQATIWISADSRRLPVKISSEVHIGGLSSLMDKLALSTFHITLESVQ